jgi:serine/threonine protein kinase
LKLECGEGPFIPDNLEDALKDFISKCLQVNPADRPTCDILFTHSFVTGSPVSGLVKMVQTTQPSSQAEETSSDTSINNDGIESEMDSVDNKSCIDSVDDLPNRG